MTAGGEDGTIRIYARVRPLRQRLRAGAAGREQPQQQHQAAGGAECGSNYYIRPATEAASDRHTLGFPVARADPLGMTNHAQDDYRFDFEGVFGMESGQEEVFDRVARPVVDRWVAGCGGWL